MNTLQQYNAIIIDDHVLFAESLSSVLERFKIFKSIHICKTEEEVTSFFLHKSIYDQSGTLVILDYYMPGKNGLSMIKEIRMMDKKIKTLFLSSVANPMIINEMLQIRPDAIVNKTEGIEQLLEALKHIDRKEQYLSDFIRQVLENHSSVQNPLSNREIELLNLFAAGLSIEKIAETLYLSPLTVMTHKRNMMKKTKSKTVLELVAFARKNGLIE
ncbi:MAG: response regulator transcription factor [Taibaiella sp.]|nr:response regulator transcription factor [Taibaiella sp.]